MNKEFLEDNALREATRVEGIGFTVTAMNDNSLFLTDEVILKLAEQIQAEKIKSA